ncbi:hypothetical protein SDC9_158228 [bioreactor metagenome]|uniref:Uncharacterized protein n=1 Tax=bioreactor metagenome TaxID=1076179 RepID=A0A645F9F8_9ZZZZ
MAFAHHAQVLALVQAAAVKRHQTAGLRTRRQIGQYGGKIAHGHIGLAIIEQGSWIARGQRQQAYAQARSLARQNRVQRRNQRGSRGIGHGDHERGGGRLGIELIGCECTLQMLQGLAYHRPQGLGTRRRLHALSLAHQQLVAQDLAQPAHGIADRRLGDAELVRRAREAALGHDLVEDAQQIEIQRTKVQRHGITQYITAVNATDSKYKFEHT